MKNVSVASHVTLVDGEQYDGIGNVLIKTLSSLCEEFIFVRHSMDGLLKSKVQKYRGSRLVKQLDLGVIRSPSMLRYLSEVLKTVYYFLFRENIDIYIGVDPLNALAGILLKKIKKIDIVIFYTADFSENRFNNKIMSTVYRLIDNYCVKHADEVWSVSSRIVKIRKDMGLPDDRNIFMPNVPPIEFNNFRKNKHDKYNLITYGIIDKQLDFDGAIKAVARLVGEYPKISLTIVGNGPQEDRLKKLSEKLHISDRVHFMGRQSLEKTLELASKSGIGLALYTGVWGFNKYGDSTKCREYFNFGLPVLSTNTHSTVMDIIESGAGLITDRSVDKYVLSINEIIKNYDLYSKNSLMLGSKYEGMHKKELQRILNE